MRITIEPTLHPDPQAAVSRFFCPRCGGVVYPPSFGCIRCERREGK